MIEFLQKIWRLTHLYRWRLWLGILSGILAGIAEPLLMLTVAIVFSVIFPSAHDAKISEYLHRLPAFVNDWVAQAQAWMSPSSGGSGPHSKLALLFLTGLVPLVMLLKGVFTYLNVYLMSWVAIRAISDLRVRVFNHLLNLPLSFFSKMSTGELMSRVNDVGVLQNIVSNSLSTIIQEPVKVTVYLASLFALQPKLTLVALVVFPVCIVPIAIYNRKSRRSSAEIQAGYASLGRMMHEAFTGNRIIKAYNLEATVIQEFKEALRKFIGHFMRVVRATEIPGPLIEFFGALGVAIILFYIGVSAGEKPTAADFLLFVGSIFGMYRPIKTIVRLFSQTEQARAATERVFELLATTTTVEEPVNPKPLRAAGADIRFENVDFDYGEKPILRGIDLTVKAGQVMALVGSSGSGKTTLTNLLLRFYDPQRGSVKIGGVDLRDVATRDLRNQIAVVTQETILFNDSIRRNIELGRPGATEAEIIAAAQHAHAQEFILEKERGYDTLIGEKGVAVSGGQRQRIAIARAILKNAPILILDEATSSLDTESERAVQGAFEELMQGRTTICIAHRLSTIQNADVIVVMDQGRIVETGRHSELLQRKGIYQKLYELQFQE